jgi:colanic acid/amylovoran biosynthesis glycosyltransferase
LHSFYGGGGEFRGLTVRRFSLWRLWQVLWIIPWVAVTRWEVFRIVLHGLLTRRAPGWWNFWENMLGAGFAALHYREFRRHPPAHIHAAWASAPATAAWILHRLNGIPYSAAAHAYDIFDHGGDWWLNEKLAEARFVHTSTEMGAAALLARGVSSDRLKVIRRGLVLAEFPVPKALRSPRQPLRILCLARLLAKKGLRRQLHLYAALRDAGVVFEARIHGDGPERPALERLRRELGLDACVALPGHASPNEVSAALAWADVLVHTGVVAPSGDRDGLPNVIPEAMAAGVLVVTSPEAATREAITHGETGLVAAVDDSAAWVDAARRLGQDDVLATRLQWGARLWVEREFDARTNAARLAAAFAEATR